MEKTKKSYGKTTIAPDVLVSIAQLATLGVDGVSHLTAGSRDVNTLFKKGINEGVNISVEDNVVYVDLYVVLKRSYNVREVSHNIQSQVARSISEMVGMEIGRINIHVEDIDFGEA
ncbi:MAG TPA: Asp23/Gls24 family envelope stress response protein [Anaerolineaceae bacterium]|nr:Asp23/Gls24 family envelope stress response protein [Anaerolineaceae bacterium]